jgi:uncharacterized membrane protein YfcA
MNDLLFIALIALVAFAYAMVGHGGASGYLALMGIAHFQGAVMKPTALLLNLCVSLIAFVQYYRSGHFRWKLFWPFAVLSIPCAFVGAGITLDDLLYKRILALCIVIAGLRLLGVFTRGQRALRDVPLAIALVLGGVIGLLSGMLGIGGGVLLSPVLLVCAWADAKTAAATASLFIFVNSAAGLIKVQGMQNAFTQDMLLWTGAAIAGGLLGSWIGARKAPEPRLRQALGMVLLAASIKLFWP